MSDDQSREIPSSQKRHSAFKPIRLGHYYLVDRIARGGMSEVYLAKTVGFGGFQKPLVIKRLLGELSTLPRYVKRFVNEAQTLARLNHPNIVQVIDAGFIEGQYYIALEYVEGRSAAHMLSKAKKKEKLPSTEFAVHLGLQVARGLAHAHRTGHRRGEGQSLVHQDINSFNVMVTYSGDVKIIDFGIARVLPAQSEDEELPVAGKLLYFSPEQLQGKPVDLRVDVYGVGMLLHELLTGERLFEHGDNVGETMKMILESDVAGKIQASDRLHRELKPILIKATALEPEARYGSMDEIIDELLAVAKKCDFELEGRAHADYMGEVFDREMQVDRRRMQRLLDWAPKDQTTAQAGMPVALDDTIGGPHDLLTRLSSILVQEPGKKGRPSAAPKKGLPRLLRVPAGRTIFRQGDPSLFLYVIQSGKVSLSLRTGRNVRTVAVLGEGDVFGETAILAERRRPLTAKAREKCVLYCLDRAAFLGLLDEKTSREVFARLVGRIKRLVTALASAVLDDPIARLLHALLTLQGQSNLQDGSMVDFAELKELTRLPDDEQLGKYLAKLEALDAVAIRNTSVVIKDYEKIENIFLVLVGAGKLSLRL
ncbi:MAG: protein kinase [Thermodesulfobacteriota bacterium]